MVRIPAIAVLALLVVARVSFAQSDEELIESVRSSAASMFQEQANWVLPESFHNSGLAASDKDKLILQLASDSADCLADTAVKYAAIYDVPISDFVSEDGTIHFDGDSGREFALLLDPCIQDAWQVAGVNPPKIPIQTASPY